jgi:hypothetical protein
MKATTRTAAAAREKGRSAAGPAGWTAYLGRRCCRPGRLQRPSSAAGRYPTDQTPVPAETSPGERSAGRVNLISVSAGPSCVSSALSSPREAVDVSVPGVVRPARKTGQC